MLVPAGLMMTSDTVLQIQNVAPCSLIAPQGIVQNKSFLSPNSANQQFIVSGNGQISPIGQMYASTPVGLVVPQSNGPAFVQQSTTIVQQQTTMMNNSNSLNETDLPANIPQSVSTQTSQANTVTTSPPDTTTHSPRSPERPESQRSVASDINMVIIHLHCVNSFIALLFFSILIKSDFFVFVFALDFRFNSFRAPNQIQWSHLWLIVPNHHRVIMTATPVRNDN